MKFNKHLTLDTDELENELAMVGAAPGAIDQIETSYMDYLEDAKFTIDDAEMATSCWLYKYDGLDPGNCLRLFRIK